MIKADIGKILERISYFNHSLC